MKTHNPPFKSHDVSKYSQDDQDFLKGVYISCSKFKLCTTYLYWSAAHKRLYKENAELRKIVSQQAGIIDRSAEIFKLVNSDPKLEKEYPRMLRVV